jgi:thioredoxin 1
MKKTYSLATIFIITMTLASCTFPWETSTQKVETETVTTEPDTTSTAASTNNDPNNTVPSLPVTKDITPSDTPKAIAEGGVYLPYTSTAVAQAKGQVVLFFHANWCPTCVAINKDIEANLKNIPTDLTILKTSFDEEKELKELYGVTAQYTFVQVDNTGKLIKKWRGGATLTEIIWQVQK